MKILFFDFTLPYLIRNSNYPAGGWATQLNAWLKGLNAIGVRTGLLTFKGAGEIVGDIELNFDLIETYDPDSGVRFIKYFTSIIPALDNAVKNYQPDVIIQACAGTQTAVLSYIARKNNVMFVHRIANDRDVDKRLRSFLSFYEYYIYTYGVKHSDILLCQNNYQLTQIKRRFPNKKSVVIHNPFLPPELPGDRERIIHRKYVAWIGRFVEQKNLPLLYSVAKQLSEYEFHIAGDFDGAATPNLKEIIEQIENLPNVTMLGYKKKSEIPSFLSNAKLLLATSFYEGFSNVFLEAFAQGTPVVAPSRIDPDNIIHNFHLGYSLSDDTLLGGKIKDIFNMNSREYDELSQRCQQYVAEHHAPDQQAAELVSYLKS